MRDEAFIDYTLQMGKSAREKVLTAFSKISQNQFNWKPSPDRWSIAQCLDHLLISDSSYFSDLQKIADGKHQMTFWEKYSPFTALFGKLFKDQLKEQVSRKMVTHKKLTPKTEPKDIGLIDTYLENLDTFLDHISNCRHIDLDKTIITSPTIRIITYSLRDALQFLMQHEHRHINQAIRVMENDNFPKK